MTHDQAIIAAALAQADAAAQREGWPGFVALTIYATDADYYALRPSEPRVPEAAARQRAIVLDQPTAKE